MFGPKKRYSYVIRHCKSTVLSAALLLVLIVGCGGGSKDSSTAQKAPAPAASPADDGKGVGPIKSVTLGPIDAAIAAEGQEIFDMKCSVCHKINERYVGPALSGVTKRRKPEWIMNMALNPDQMIKDDPTARQLFTEYLTPMTFQNVTEDDVTKILMYFRSIESDSSAAPAESE